MVPSLEQDAIYLLFLEMVTELMGFLWPLSVFMRDPLIVDQILTRLWEILLNNGSGIYPSSAPVTMTFPEES